MTAVVPTQRPRRADTGVIGPARRPEHRRSQHLRPVERPRPKRSPAVPALVGVGIVIAALLGLAGMHAVLIGGQVRLDAMRSDVASETEAIRRLELRVAELESPDRVLDVARDRIGMVQPTEVGYLLHASAEVPDAEPVRVAAATTPDPEPTASDADAEAGADLEADADPETDPAVTRSAEQAEVDDALTATDAPTVTDAGADTDPSEGGRDE